MPRRTSQLAGSDAGSTEQISAPSIGTSRAGTTSPWSAGASSVSASPVGARASATAPRKAVSTSSVKA
jgi:hypothetical protein